MTITFTDFKVDVVPGFYREGGGFLIPDSKQGRWISTDPKKHVAIWSEANRAHNGELVPVVKLLKASNKPRDLLRSFHLEVLALDVFSGVTISNDPSAVRYFFDKAREKIRFKLPDPSGYSDDVATHITSETDMRAIIDRLEWARQTAVDAERLAAQGSIEAAHEKWRLIFKDYFPAYR